MALCHLNCPDPGPVCLQIYSLPFLCLALCSRVWLLAPRSSWPVGVLAGDGRAEERGSQGISSPPSFRSPFGSCCPARYIPTNTRMHPDLPLQSSGHQGKWEKIRIGSKMEKETPPSAKEQNQNASDLATVSLESRKVIIENLKQYNCLLSWRWEQ